MPISILYSCYHSLVFTIEMQQELRISKDKDRVSKAEKNANICDIFCLSDLNRKSTKSFGCSKACSSPLPCLALFSLVQDATDMLHPPAAWEVQAGSHTWNGLGQHITELAFPCPRLPCRAHVGCISCESNPAPPRVSVVVEVQCPSDKSKVSHSPQN